MTASRGINGNGQYGWKVNDCPLCGARAGNPCVRLGGTHEGRALKQPHADRADRTDEVLDE